MLLVGDAILLPFQLAPRAGRRCVCRRTRFTGACHGAITVGSSRPMTNKLLLSVFLLAASALAQVAPGSSPTGPASSIVGQLQTATGGIIKSGTLTFTLSQPAIASGTASIIPQATACYTSNQGNIVGLPEVL